jgi:hypothetical protein
MGRVVLFLLVTYITSLKTSGACQVMCHRVPISNRTEGKVL